MNTSSQPRWKRLLAILVGLAVSSGFVVLMISGIDLARVIDEIRQVDVAVLSLTLVTSFAGFLAMATRSAVLLRPLHAYRPFQLFKSVLVSYAGNNVLPLRMGELLRIDYLARHGRCPHTSCLAVLAVERLLDLSCLVLLFFGLLPLVVVEMPSASAPGIVGAIVVASLVGLAWIGSDRQRFVKLSGQLTSWLGEGVSRWITSKAARFAEGLGALTKPTRVVAAIGLSWVYWLAGITGLGIALAAFDIDLPWYAPAVVIVFITFGVALPSAPAFIGTFHYFAMLALTLMGVDQERAVSFAVVIHAFGMVPFTLLGILLLYGEIVRGDLPLRQRLTDRAADDPSG